MRIIVQLVEEQMADLASLGAISWWHAVDQ